MDAIWDYRWNLLDGALVTVEIAVLSTVLATGIGLLGSWAKLSPNSLVHGIANGYTTLVRGIPDLVLMLLVFFGGQQLLNDLGQTTGLWDYVEINPFIAGTLTIGFIFGAYMTETFRGAYLAIHRGQIEAAKACGMSRSLVFRRVIWPQLLHYALPSFTNNWLVLLKATALISVIGLQDIVYNANAAGKATREPFAFFFAVLVVYLILTALSELGLRHISRRIGNGMMATQGGKS